MSPDATPTIPVRRITLMVCEMCLVGDGGQCWVPGCAFWASRAPTKPLYDERGRYYSAVLRDLDTEGA